jgi:hypothetical protein
VLRTIWEWVINTLFKVSTQATNMQIDSNNSFAEEYKRIDQINFNAIFSNKLSNYVVADSVLEVTGENKRAEYLNDGIMKSIRKKIKKATGMAFGLGGVLIVPYAKKSSRTGKYELYYDLVEQNRMTVDQTDGEIITGATILAEEKKITRANRVETFLRWSNYLIENGSLIITQKFTNEDGKEIPVPSFWADINPQLMIRNVDRILFGYIKSPVNNRSTNDDYGVPITYGCDSTIAEIRECLKQIVKEFKNKEALVGLDKKAFGVNNRLPESGIFQQFDMGQDGFWEEFSPAIRDSSFYARLQELYSRLEREVGVSAGFLTRPETQNATATEVRRSMYDTFVIVDDMRDNLEQAIDDFMYSCDMLCNAYNIVPSGDYELSYDWSYSLLEDSSEEFRQLMEAKREGAVAIWEIRNWLKPSETLEESQKAIEEIKQATPSIANLVGSE